MIYFETINCDGNKRVWDFDTLQEIKDNWWSDDCTLPMMDDEAICLNINGKNIEGIETFEDIAFQLGLS